MMQVNVSSQPADPKKDTPGTYATLRVDSQLFGIHVDFVRDVLPTKKATPIPLSPKEIDGSINLRGRIVTIINLRRRLALPDAAQARTMCVVVEYHNELFGLIADSVDEVMTVPAGAIEQTPANLQGAWKQVVSGIHKLDNELLAIIDIETLLAL